MKLLKNPVADRNENINLKTVVAAAGSWRPIIIIMNPLFSYEELADPESRIAQEALVNPAALTSRVQKSNIPE